MIRFVHTSDLHFHRCRARNRGVEAALGAIRRSFFDGECESQLLVTRLIRELELVPETRRSAWAAWSASMPLLSEASTTARTASWG